MPTLANHLRALWHERAECINPVLPADLPAFCRELASSGEWRAAALERAGKIDAEVADLLTALRELGITEVRSHRGQS